MSFVRHPWQLFFLILSGLVDRRQQEIIESQNAQIRTLMEKMGRRRILLTDGQRRVLAAKGKALGRRTLMELTTIVTPDTILRWHRRLIAEKWDYSDRHKKAPERRLGRRSPRRTGTRSRPSTSRPSRCGQGTG